MAGAESATTLPAERLNVYMAGETRERVKRAAANRKTSESATAEWLIGKGLDWYEALADDQRAAV